MFFKKQFIVRKLEQKKNNVLYLPPPLPTFVTISNIFILN